MKYLMNQSEFEILIGKEESSDTVPVITVIYFTASWCKPCQKIDKEMLERSLSSVNFLICDIDQNDYTAGYCGIRKIPTFMVIHKKKIIKVFSSSNTNEIVQQINQIDI